MDKYNFPQGVEVVCSALIEAKDGKILLGRSPKWHNKWIFPGGHIDAGETIKEAVRREAKEEVGIDVRPTDWLVFGELINSKDFHRPGHFIYFDVLCLAQNEQVKIDQREIVDYLWVDPQEALKMDLADTYSAIIRKYLAYKKNKI